MDQRNLTRYIDIAFCVVLLPTMIMMLPVDKWLVHRTSFIVMLVIWLYIVYAIHRCITIPMIFRSKRHQMVALGVALLTLVITLLLTIEQEDRAYDLARAARATASGHNINRPPKPFITLQQQATWFLYMIVSAFSVAVSLLAKLSQQILRNHSIEFERKRAELALYKAQINPHFLFNTLNALYGLIITKSDQAEEAFVRFTSMMKYIYTNGSADKIGVEAEVEYIEQYIELQRLRIDPRNEILFHYNGGGGALQIAPMLLITFVENAIKYGISPEVTTQVTIDITVEEGELKLETNNKIVNHKERSAGGIGIENCRKRLELLYPRRYSVAINDSGEEYNLTLKIKLQ